MSTSKLTVQDIAITACAVSLALCACLSLYKGTAPISIVVNSNPSPTTDASADAAPEPAVKTDKEKADTTEERYEIKKQVWNSSDNCWTDQEEQTLTDEEKAKAAKLLFSVRIRQSADVDEDSVNPNCQIMLKSETLRRFLKEILKEVEELQDFEPTFDAQHVFRHWAELTKLVESKKAQLANMENVSVPTTDGNTAKANGIISKKSKKYTKEELTEQLDAVPVLFTFIEKYFATTRDTMQRLNKAGMITYKLLWAIFIKDCKVATVDEDSGELLGFQLKSMSYEDSRACGKYFELNGQHLEWEGKKYIRRNIRVRIPQFRGSRRIASLEARPMSEPVEKELTERGRIYCQHAGSHYVNYTGELIKVHYNMMGKKVTSKSRADGRVMIDRESYKIAEPDGYGADSGSSYEDCDCSSCTLNARLDVVEDGLTDDELEGVKAHLLVAEQDEKKKDVHEKDLCLLPPIHFAFSFELRAFGQVRINFSEIKFDEHAWEHLVLDKRTKDIIYSLVKAAAKDHKKEGSKELISDVISKKGGGLITLLHGKPGVGKTLTAEAIAEHLKKPLYIVSSGQLGQESHSLETSLRSTLELAERWNCVLLIDEADVFLESRSDGFMYRNGMVAVFLKLLEYFNGLLFLTTNRVSSFDDAFISRFSVAIKYNDLDKDSRTHIWKKFLALTNVQVESGKEALNGVTNGSQGSDLATGGFITRKDFNKLVEFEMNGRVIKQIMRAAQALALSEGKPISMSHIQTVVDFQQDFQKDFKHPGEIDYEAKDARWGGHKTLYH